MADAAPLSVRCHHDHVMAHLCELPGEDRDAGGEDAVIICE
jgi:hypothetical protein